MLKASTAVPPDWALRCGGGRLTMGYDVATTEKKSSNPSAITVMEKLSGTYWQRLIVRFKSEDPDIPRIIISSILDARPAAEWKCLNVDASSERLNAQTVRKVFRNRLRVNLIVNSEAIDFQGERYSYKTLLGDLYVSAFEDAKIAIPPEIWVMQDHRLTKKMAGGYVTETDDEGGHGDTFDSGKLCYWGHISGGGNIRAEAASVGSIRKNNGFQKRPGIIGPIGGKNRSNQIRMNS